MYQLPEHEAPQKIRSRIYSGQDESYQMAIVVGIITVLKS